jgi:Spy/CpxP family protein refolding chaperone
MNRWNRVALAVSALVVMSGSVLAQTPATPATPKVKGVARGGQGRRAGMTSLPVSAIDALVTLKEDQKTKISAIEDKLKTDVAAAAGDKVKTRELTAAANTDIKAVLTADQQTTLTEKLPVVMLLNQSKAVPAGAFGDVKLTADQMDKIKTVAMATQEKLKALAKEDRKTKNPEILADFKTQVDAILTAEQKATVGKFHAPKGKKKIAV